MRSLMLFTKLGESALSTLEGSITHALRPIADENWVAMQVVSVVHEDQEAVFRIHVANNVTPSHGFVPPEHFNVSICGATVEVDDEGPMTIVGFDRDHVKPYEPPVESFVVRRHGAAECEKWPIAKLQAALEAVDSPHINKKGFVIERSDTPEFLRNHLVGVIEWANKKGLSFDEALLQARELVESKRQAS